MTMPLLAELYKLSSALLLVYGSVSESPKLGRARHYIIYGTNRCELITLLLPVWCVLMLLDAKL